MTVFFIIISLILNVIAILAIIIIYLRQNRLLELEEVQKRNLKEMEELISSYLLEMKDENEHFLERIKEISNQKSDLLLVHEGQELDKKVELIYPSQKWAKQKTLHGIKAYQQTQKQNDNSLIKENNFVDDTNEAKSNTNQAPSILIKSAQDTLLEQILTMKQTGLTLDEMARKLNKGKTEIELLLKFRENHQE